MCDANDLSNSKVLYPIDIKVMNLMCSINFMCSIVKKICQKVIKGNGYFLPKFYVNEVLLKGSRFLNIKAEAEANVIKYLQ